MSAPTTTLEAHKAWLFSVGALEPEGCTCPYRWGNIGRGWGDGWLRQRDEKGCPTHNRADNKTLCQAERTNRDE